MPSTFRVHLSGVEVWTRPPVPIRTVVHGDEQCGPVPVMAGLCGRGSWMLPFAARRGMKPLAIRSDPVRRLDCLPSQHSVPLLMAFRRAARVHAEPVSRKFKVIGTRLCGMTALTRSRSREVRGRCASDRHAGRGRTAQPARAREDCAVECRQGAGLAGLCGPSPPTRSRRPGDGCANWGKGRSMRHLNNNVLAADKVLYRGHAIAAVAADNVHIAEEAGATDRGRVRGSSRRDGCWSRPMKRARRSCTPA